MHNNQKEYASGKSICLVSELTIVFSKTDSVLICLSLWADFQADLKSILPPHTMLLITLFKAMWGSGAMSICEVEIILQLSDFVHSLLSGNLGIWSPCQYSLTFSDMYSFSTSDTVIYYCRCRGWRAGLQLSYREQ
jgi:hypothetical protein